MIPIYIKTVYSFLESLIDIDDLIKFGKENDLKYLCICDDNLYGSMEFINKCLDNNIIPIIGLDIGMCLLYTKNYDGYVNLIKLKNLKEERDLNLDDLKEYSANLICFKNELDSNNLENEVPITSLSELRWYHVKCVLRIRTFYF